MTEHAPATVHHGRPRSSSVELLSRVTPALWVATLYLVLSLAFTQFRGVFEIDTDEGNNLIKALLLQHGLSFGQIWSDQPPLFAAILWGIFRVFGWHVAVARELVLVFTAALLFAIYDSVVAISRRSCGLMAAHLGAFLSVVLVVLSFGFAVWRVCVMIGLPCIALTALSLWAAIRGGEHDPTDRADRRFWLLTSGVLLGLSLSTKLFTAFVVPAVLLQAISPELSQLGQGGTRPALRAAGVFGLGFGAALLVGLGPLLISGDIWKLYEVHALAQAAGYRSVNTLFGLVERDEWLFGLAILGGMLVLWFRLRAALPFVFWLTAAMVLLSNHDPLWAHHHQLMVTPAAALAGVGVAIACRRVGRWLAPTIAAALLATTLLSVGVNAPRRFDELLAPYPHEQSRDWKIVGLLKKRHLEGATMVTARQIYAFHLGLSVPPELAVTSAKRFHAGMLNADTIIAAIRKSHAEVVVVAWPWPRKVRDAVRHAIAKQYRVIYEAKTRRPSYVYLRRDRDSTSTTTH